MGWPSALGYSMVDVEKSVGEAIRTHLAVMGTGRYTDRETIAYFYQRNRSGSENLTLAIQSPHSIPYRHGNTACHTPRHVGTAPARSASLYSGTGSACGGIGGHGACVTRAQPRLAGAAAPDLTELLASPCERPAPCSLWKKWMRWS